MFGSRSFDTWKSLYVLMFAAVGFLTLFPVFTLAFGSFWGAPLGAVGSFSLSGWINAFIKDPSTYGVLLNSFIIAFGTTASAVIVGVLLAWVVARTDLPGRRVWEVLVSLPFFFPPILTALSWAMLGNPQTGLINKLFMMFPGVNGPLIDVYSLGGIIWHMSQFSSAFVFMLIVAAFRGMDPSLEESSRMSGAGDLSTLVRITLPIMKPAILGAAILSFCRGLEAFESPLFFGLPANINVLTTRIFTNIMDRTPPRYGEAMALAIALILITLILVAIQWKLLGTRQYTTITGKGYQPRLIKLGPAKWLAWAFCLLYFVVSIVLPVSQLLLSSFFKIFGLYTPETFTLANYQNVLSDALVWRSFGNSLILGGAGAFAAVTLGMLVAYVVNRTQLRGRRVLDFVAWLPWTLPGTVLGLGMLWGYILLPGFLNIYGTIWILLVAYVTMGLPLSTRTMTGTIVQISPDLEECSRVHGAGRVQTFFRIVLALVRPGFFTAFILIFFLVMRELSASILLYSLGHEVVPVVILKYWLGGRPEAVSVIAFLMVILVIVFRVLELFLRRTKLAQ